MNMSNPAANVDYVLHSCRLSGASPSPILRCLMDRYRLGRVSASKMVEAINTHYRAARGSNEPTTQMTSSCIAGARLSVVGDGA